MATYADLLRDVRWQKKRLEVLSRDQWACVKCGKSEGEMHVHHTRYDRNKAPWEYENSLLETLCSNCHLVEHPKKTKLPIRESDPGWTFDKSELYSAPEQASRIQEEISALQQKLIRADHIATQIIMQQIIDLQRKKKNLLNP